MVAHFRTAACEWGEGWAKVAGVSASSTHTAAIAISGLCLAVVAAAGAYMSGKIERDSRARLSVLVDAGTVDEAPEVGAMAAALAADPARFAEEVAADASAFGVAEVSITTLAEAQPHVVAIADPITLSPGKTWSGSGLRIKASFEKVKYQDHGATVTARHSVLTVTNESDRPLAWFLRARASGSCEIRGARMHDAMVLRPGDAAEVVVCAGPSKPQIQRLETLGVSELGARYLGQVPPVAVGHDAVTDRAHRPHAPVRRCDVDTRAISGALRDGRARWVDVVDFYSRHNCHRHAFFVGYTHVEGPVARLPALPP